MQPPMSSVGDVCAVDRLFVGDTSIRDPSVDAEAGAILSVGDRMGASVSSSSSGYGSVLTLYRPCRCVDGEVTGEG
jgi:hypothetical protein